jgi:hypothetical protein
MFFKITKLIQIMYLKLIKKKVINYLLMKMVLKQLNKKNN